MRTTTGLSLLPFLALLSCVSTPVVDAQGQRLTPELLWKLGRVGDPQLSADGRHLLYTVRTYDLQANKGRTQIFLRDLRKQQAVQITKESSNWNPRWSAQGDRVAFLSSRSGSAQIWVMDLKDATPGALRQVTRHKGGVANMAWSPDDRHFSFTAGVKLDKDIHDRYPDLPKADARIFDDLLIRHWDRWRDGKYSHLFVVPAGGGAAKDLMASMRVDTPMAPFGGGEQIAWSPDGKAICYTAKVARDPESSTDSSLFMVRLDAPGQHRNITNGMPGYDMEPVFSPDGRYIAFHSMARAGFEADRNRLMLYDRRTGNIEEATQDRDQSVFDTQWSRDGKTLYFAGYQKGERHIWRLAPGGEARQISAGRYYFNGIEPAPDRGVYTRRMQFERPHEVVYLNGDVLSEGDPVTDVNGAIYKNLALPQVKERWFTATDGKRIHSWVFYPPDFDAADNERQWPMLLYCQGGPQSQVGQWFSYRWNFHLMAANGYIVLAVNRRGLPGFGRKWNDAISRDWGGQAMRDLLTATDEMVKEPYVDRDRVGAIGASYGGYAIYWLMGHDQENRFQAMIAHCGVFNLESMYLATEELFFVNWDLGGPFWKNAAVQRDYDRFSPHRFVGNWKTPLLVIHGQRDYRVPVTEGMQAFTAAQVQGVPSRFLYFPEEGHWVLSPQNGVLWHRVFFDWLQRYLKK
ncbi:MAG: alpha/beta hydrolase family protein [Planctomycetota bacterium]|jgi:dipeptidyl aminopeptidase/acylaminoacyl peptidase